jgi:hypothetical protein
MGRDQCSSGCVGGSLFHLFLGNERDIDRLFIPIAGAVILVSGAAGLRVSPLLPTISSARCSPTRVQP